MPPSIIRTATAGQLLWRIGEYHGLQYDARTLRLLGALTTPIPHAFCLSGTPAAVIREALGQFTPHLRLVYCHAGLASIDAKPATAGSAVTPTLPDA